MTPELSVDWLKAHCEMIHYFGLGFIQIKLDQANRVHVYTGALPRTVEEEDVHDHRYNFVSRILHGALDQRIFEVPFDGTPTHFMVQENCQPKADNHVPEESKLCRIQPVFQKVYLAGDSYFIDHNTFHTVDSHDAITHVCRGGYQKDLANVVYPMSNKLVCPFSIKVPEEQLWEIVGQRIEEISDR